MVFQGRSIQAKVDLDLEPFATKLSEMGTMLNELTKGVNVDFGGSKLATQMDDLKVILRGVSEEAQKITTAFNNIQGLSNFLDNLQAIKTKLETIQGDVDKINKGILKEAESVTKVASSEQKLNDITQKRVNALTKIGKEIIKNGSEIKKNLTYEEEMLATEQLFQNALGEEIANRFRIKAEIEQTNELFMAGRELESAVVEILTEEEGIISRLTGEKEKTLATLKEQLALEEDILAVEKQQTTEETKQNAERTAGAKGNLLDKGSYLPRRIGSMAVTMLGYQEIMDIWEKSTSNLNARGSFKYFGEALQKDQRYLDQTKQSTTDVSMALRKLGTDLDLLQKKYQKIDMTTVGANAEETAYKYGLQADKIGDLSEVMAIYGSEFVKQGRSQEDSILALNDALDGELRRLKEVNVGRDELEAHGWTGDQASMIDALKQIADERGYTLTAQNITNLSDAIEVLELKISRDLVSAFEYVEPVLLEVAKDIMMIIEALEWLADKINEIWKKVSTRLDIMFGVQNMQKFGDVAVKVIGGIITGLIGLYIIKKVAGVFKGGWNMILDVLGKTKPIDKASESLGKLGGVTDTGGTKTPKEHGGFGDGIKGLKENLGKMAKVFIEVAVAMAMAFALLEEALLLIAGIGYTYDRFKPQFDKGIEFIKEFGVWIWGASAILIGVMGIVGHLKIPYSTFVEGFKTVAVGLGLAMGVIAEAILLLNAPLLAIASIGAVANWQEENIETGMSTIRMFGNAIHYIASDETLGWFVIGLVAISGLLGLTADVVAVPLVVGIATSLLLVAEAILMLVAPLGAIAVLGAVANSLNEADIQQGAETIKLIGRVLKVLSGALVDLFIVDIATLGVMLTDMASKLITGKTGLEALVDDIIPNLTDFIGKFNDLDMGDPVDQAKVQAITQMAIDLPPLFNAIQKVNQAFGTTNAVGNVFGAIGGGISGMIGMGLKGKLDQLYNDVKDVMDFANKLGGLSNGGGNNASAIQQTANAIVQLRVKLNLLVSTVSSASSRVQSASQKLGSALSTGFRTGSANFNATVVSVLAKGISEIQSRYATFNNGGKTLGQKMVDGFKNHKPTLKSIISKEIDYALTELDNAKDDFYNRGQALGKQLSDGFESSGGLNVGSPANIARTIAKEMEYSMLALDNGKQLMYKGGVALGQALTNGYNSYGNLRTDVGILASKGISNEQIKANARNVQANIKGDQQNPQLAQTNINIDMSNSTVIGVQDLDAKIRQAVEKAIVNINSPNGAIGY